MTPTKPRKRGAKGERTRTAILQAIVALANERALADIRVTDVCARAGLATGAFYFHFEGRDEALEATAVAIVSELFEAALAAPTETGLHAELLGLFDVFDRARILQAPSIRALYIILNARRPVRLAWIEIRKRLIDRLAAAFDRECEAIGARGGFASPYVLAQFLLGALERFYDDVFFFPPDERLPVEAASREVFVRQQASVWYRAATGRDPPQA